MGGFIAGRLAQAFISMFVVTIAVFGVVRLSGDPLQLLLPDEAPPEQYEQMKEALHLDRPIVVQYWEWVSKVAVGDLGTSTSARVPVLELITGRLPNTLQLATVAFASLCICHRAGLGKPSSLRALARLRALPLPA